MTFVMLARPGRVSEYLDEGEEEFIEEGHDGSSQETTRKIAVNPAKVSVVLSSGEDSIVGLVDGRKRVRIATRFDEVLNVLGINLVAFGRPNNAGEVAFNPEHVASVSPSEREDGITLVSVSDGRDRIKVAALIDEVVARFESGVN
jgi:hypothetical protein